MPSYWFMLGALAVWRATHLVQAEDGPFDIVVWLRRRAGRLGRALDCFYCLSVWMAAPFAGVIGATWRERLLLWPALSAAAIVIERVTGRREVAPPIYVEHEEADHVVLREQASRAPEAAAGGDRPPA